MGEETEAAKRVGGGLPLSLRPRALHKCPSDKTKPTLPLLYLPSPFLSTVLPVSFELLSLSPRRGLSTASASASIYRRLVRIVSTWFPLFC